MFHIKSLAIGLCLAATARSAIAQPPQERQLANATLRMRAWIGLGVACSYCSLHDDGDNPSWHFPSPPVIAEITPGGPAAASGLAIGDTLTEIDGVSLTTDEGGRRFAQIKGDAPVKLGFTHGSTKGVATVVPASILNVRLTADTAGRKLSSAEVLRRFVADTIELRDVADRVRAALLAVQSTQFTGTVAGADIEVRGRNVQVSSDRSTGKLVIHGDSLTVTVSPATPRKN